MAAVAMQRPSAAPRPNFKPIIEHAVSHQAPTTTEFDPAKHLNFTFPSGIITMKDIGYADNIGVSPVAVSQPFQLFSQDAVQQMRAEIFKPEVMENCSFRSNLAASQLRGYSPKYVLSSCYSD